MIKKSPKKYLVFLLVIELLFITYAVNSYITFKSEGVKQFSAGSLSNRIGELVEDAYYIDSSYFATAAGNGISTGAQTFTYGPYVEVGHGTYSVTLNYHTDTDGNSCYVFSNSLTSSQLSSSYRIALPKEQTSVTFTFRLTKRVEDLEIITEYCGQGSLCIEQIELTQTPIYHIRNIFITLAGCLIVLLIYYFYVSNLSVRKNILWLTLITLASCYPLFTDYISSGHDLPFHITRIEGLAQGLMQGTFPVKIQPFWANGHGYAVGVFYGDILLHIPALLRLAGFSLMESYKAYVFVINFATVWISWKCFKGIFQSNRIGLIGAFLYTLAPYRLSNVYLRCSVGEYTALTFMPLVLYGFYRIFTEDPAQKGYWKNFIFPALGLTGIIQSHVISCEMVGIFIIFACLIMVKKICNLRIFLTLCLAAFVTVLLNLNFLVPFLSYFGGDFVMNSPNWYSTPIQSAGAYIAQLFPIFQNGIGSSAVTAGGMAGEMPMGAGFTLFIGLLLFFYLRFCTTLSGEKGTLYKFTCFSALLAVLSLYMSTNIFPWNSLADSSKLFTTMVYNLQFPWRFLTIATLFLVMVTCGTLLLAHKQFKKEKMTFIMGLLLCFFITSTCWFYYDLLNRGDLYRPYASTDLNSMLLGSEEYLPTGTVLSRLNTTAPTPQDDIEITDYVKNGTNISMHITGQTSAGYVELPLLYYEGYTAVSGDLTLPLKKGTNNVICLEIPANFDGEVSVFFKEPLSWRLGELISLCTVLGIIIGLLITALKASRKKEISDEV
ncbi:MAG: hypothetical protein IJ282_07165 [Lachnospiraceae bacterium]|nr:hypothetical protein [Lachnospiraceae bacterium]